MAAPGGEGLDCVWVEGGGVDGSVVDSVEVGVDSVEVEDVFEDSEVTIE